MYKNILFVLFLILIPPVFAEEKFVTLNQTIEYDSEEKKIFLYTNSIIDDSEKFEFSIDGDNSSFIEEVEYIIKTDLSCTVDEVTNVTKEIIDVCKSINDTIVHQVLNASKEAGFCKSDNQTKEILFSNLNSCQSEKEKLLARPVVEEGSENLWIGGIIGFMLGVVVVYGAKNVGPKTKTPEDKL